MKLLSDCDRKKFRNRLTLKDKDISKYRFRIADEAGKEDALNLVHQEYCRKGLWNESSPKDDLISIHRLPETICITAFGDGRLVGTVSLFPDRDGGLPSEKIFHDEIEAFRCTGRKIGEAGALISLNRDLTLLFGLLKTLHGYSSRILELDDLFITAHPVHSLFYQTFLCMDMEGDSRAHPSFNNSPAQLLRLDLPLSYNRFLATYPRSPEEKDLHRFFFRYSGEFLPRELRNDGNNKETILA